MFVCTNSDRQNGKYVTTWDTRTIYKPRSLGPKTRPRQPPVTFAQEIGKDQISWILE